jgi:hypothetical protein
MTRPNSVKHHKSHERDAPAPVASDSFKTVCNGVNWEWPVAIRGRKMLPTTRFSNLRRFTRIAQCVTAVARLCKSITPNADCYFLLLKCCQSEKKNRFDRGCSKASGRACSIRPVPGRSVVCCRHRPIYRVLCEPSKRCCEFPQEEIPAA